MSSTTRVGALVLVAGLVALRFMDGAVGAMGVVMGLAVLVAGLVVDRRAKRAAALAPPANWAEDFTAKVRRDRAAAAAAAAASAAAAARVTAEERPAA
jgi:hypothetical protein